MTFDFVCPFNKNHHKKNLKKKLYLEYECFTCHFSNHSITQIKTIYFNHHHFTSSIQLSGSDIVIVKQQYRMKEFHQIFKQHTQQRIQPLFTFHLPFENKNRKRFFHWKILKVQVNVVLVEKKTCVGVTRILFKDGTTHLCIVGHCIAISDIE